MYVAGSFNKFNMFLKWKGLWIPFHSISSIIHVPQWLEGDVVSFASPTYCTNLARVTGIDGVVTLDLKEFLDCYDIAQLEEKVRMQVKCCLLCSIKTLDPICKLCQFVIKQQQEGFKTLRLPGSRDDADTDEILKMHPHPWGEVVVLK